MKKIFITLLYLILALPGFALTRPDYAFIKNTPQLSFTSFLGKSVASATSAEITSAINAALASATANGGGVVTFPALPTGVYTIDDTIVIPENVTIEGYGSQYYAYQTGGVLFQNSASFPAGEPMFVLSLNSVIRNCNILATPDSVDLIGVQLGVNSPRVNGAYSRVENMSIRGAKIGVKVGYSWGYIVDNVHTHSGETGFEIDCGTSFEFNRCSATVPTKYGFNLTGTGSFATVYGVFNSCNVDNPTSSMTACFAGSGQYSGITVNSFGVEIATATGDVFALEPTYETVNNGITIISPYVSRYSGTWTGNVINAKNNKVVATVMSLCLGSTQGPDSPGYAFKNASESKGITVINYVEGGSFATDNKYITYINSLLYDDAYMKYGGYCSKFNLLTAKNIRTVTVGTTATSSSVLTPAAGEEYIVSARNTNEATVDVRITALVGKSTNNLIYTEILDNETVTLATNTTDLFLYNPSVVATYSFNVNCIRIR